MTTSNITTVTVFLDRARITRSATAQVQPGLQKITLTDLPLAMDTESVRARGGGSAQAALLGLAVRKENFVETPAQHPRDLQEQIRTISDAITSIDARVAAIQLESNSLENLMGQGASFARGINKGQRSADEQIATLSVLRERLLALKLESLQSVREKRDRTAELDKLKRDLERAGQGQQRQRYAADIELEVRQSGDVTIELTYGVHGASWKPIYDLRSNDAALEVRYLAEVSQTTGEDWMDVALNLSTAQPGTSLIVPELDPWYVQPKPPPQPRVLRTRSSDETVMAMAPVAMAAPSPMAKVLDFVETDAIVNPSGAALTYALPGRASVPGNGETRKVTVAVLPLKGRMDYITAPKLDSVVYRRCQARNDSRYTLLPGRGQLLEGDNFLGACEIDQTAPNQEMELAFGADERVRVERELTMREVDKTLLGDKRRTRFAYKITIDNLRSEAVEVLVRDQIPLSRSEEIKVRLENAEPKVTTQTPLNVLEWKLAVGAGEKRGIRFEYTVEHPRQMDVLGMD